MKVRVAKKSELFERGRIFVEVGGTEIAVIIQGENLYAIKNFCPHMGAALGKGPITDPDGRPIIECPFHGWRFDMESGDSTFSTQKKVKTYPVELEDDYVVVEVESE